MPAGFRHIIDTLNAMVTFRFDSSMTDEDFIANIDAVNLLCNVLDGLDLDTSGIVGQLDCLYPELTRRIFAKEDVQLAMPLIKALHRLIYGRDNDLGSEQWRSEFAEICCQVVAAYRKNPLIHRTDYLFALDTVIDMQPKTDNAILSEYKAEISALLADIDEAPLAEKVRRERAYERSALRIASADRERWDDVRAEITAADLSQLDDQSLILWREITDMPALDELQKRTRHSRQMQVEHLQALTLTRQYSIDIPVSELSKLLGN